MRILHIYPRGDKMIAQYVNILTEGMRQSANVQTADSIISYKNKMKEHRPDILHCHGCWQYWLLTAVQHARLQGVRIVVSPHGQLEPWNISERSTKDKICQSKFLQRYTIVKAYSIIAFGKMERHYLESLGWNQRIEVVSNSIITNSITDKEMCSRVFAVYQKVTDSNVLETMTSADHELLTQIIKVGITGDRRWVNPEEIITQQQSSPADWRRILLYADHQNIRNYVDYGINQLGLKADMIDTQKIPAYFPSDYKRPAPIKDLIGDYQGDESDYVVRIIKQIQRTAPLLLHLIELHRELRRDNLDEDKFQRDLEEAGLTAYASRLMQIVSEETLLDEGFMPIEPKADRRTRHIRNLLANHLRI